MAIPIPSLARPSGAAARARAKAKREPGLTYLEPRDHDAALAIHRLNTTGWAGDPADLSAWQHEQEELLELLWQARQELYAQLGIHPINPERTYLQLRWLPRCGPTFIALVRVLRGKLYLNRSTGELRELWFEDGVDLAAAMGVSQATFWRLLKRARDSADAPLYRQFLLRRRRRRYDAAAQAVRVASNEYLVAVEDPLTPEDAEWVLARAYELLAEHRAVPVPPTPGPTMAAPEHRLVLESQNALSPCVSECSLTLREQRDPLEKHNQERGSHRSPRKEREAAFPVATAIRNVANHEAVPEQAAQREHSLPSSSGMGNGRYTLNTERHIPIGSFSPSNTSMYAAAPHAYCGGERPLNGEDNEEDRVVGMSDIATDAVLSEQELAVARAAGIIERVAGDLLEQFGDLNVRSGITQLAQQLARYRAPASAMIDLCYLGRARVRRFQARGGSIHTSKAAFFLTTTKNAIAEAARIGWKIAKMEEVDQKAHARQLARAESRARSGRSSGEVSWYPGRR